MTEDARPPGTVDERRVTRRRIVDVALEYVEAGDEAALTMRALGQRLGVSSMALYRYFSSKEEMLGEVVDTLLARLPPPARDAGDWEGWLEDSALTLRDFLVTYSTALHTFTSHPVTTPAAMARMESALSVLRGAGFSGPHAARAFAAVHTYTIGFAALQVSRSRTRAPAPVGADPSRYWHLFFGTLPPDRFPNLVDLAPDLAMFTSPEQFQTGLRSLLRGLRAELEVPTPGRAGR